MSVAIAQHYSSIRVRYADTDQMRVVHHSKYFEYFEIGRSDLIRALGMPYGDMEAKGIFLPVIEAVAKFLKPAQYDEVLTVETSICEMPVVTLTIEYRILRHNREECLAEGRTVHGFLNAKTGRPTRAPKDFLQLFNK
ncbi:MAG: thioesterase family protein [Bacteroidota bacterium]